MSAKAREGYSRGLLVWCGLGLQRMARLMERGGRCVCEGYVSVGSNVSLFDAKRVGLVDYCHRIHTYSGRKYVG